MAEQRVAEQEFYEEFDPAKLIAKIKNDALNQDDAAADAASADKDQ